MMPSVQTKKYIDNIEKRKYSALFYLFVISTCCKVLVLDAYRSTDFDVHRHWKAVTRHLPPQHWYFDDQFVETRHTLDYPPGFAWFEAFWSRNPVTQALIDNNIVDAKCLELIADQDWGVSRACVIFMRATVILSDFIWWIGAWAAARTVSANPFKQWSTFTLLVFHPALFWLDHVHFQYNGMLFGVLLLSMAFLLQGNRVKESSWTFHAYHCLGAILFAMLLTLKHLYLTLSIWYFAYLLRRYCLLSTHEQPSTCLSSKRLAILGSLTVLALLAPFVPLLTTTQDRSAISVLQQIAKRLFPFGRGLVHDYWAANVWAVHAATNKVLPALSISPLPEPSPAMTASLLLIMLLPGAAAGWIAGARRDNRLLVLSASYTAMASFHFAYHVHEKAIVTTLLLLTLALATAEENRSSYVDDILWKTTLWSTLALFPLLFQSQELGLKLMSYISYMALLHNATADNVVHNPFRYVEFLFKYRKELLCFIATAVMIQLEVIPLSFWGRYAFAPLAITSLTCATGLLQCFAQLSFVMIFGDNR